MAIKAFTANRLGDGAVVFLDGNYGWSQRFADARLFSTDSELEDLTLVASRAEETGQVVGAYPIEVDYDFTLRLAMPARLRERIRAFGPTVSSEASAQTT